MARTPSKEAHAKVLKAVLELVGERGVEGTSMDAIAAAAGVSKATVYKHWENKDALLVDAIRVQGAKSPTFASGNLRKDLTDLLTYLAHKSRSQEPARFWPNIISYAASNPDFGKVLQERLFAPRREGLLAMLAAGAAAGVLEPNIDPDLAADLLIGPIMHRRFVNNNNVPPELPEKVVAVFFRAFAPAIRE